jgi:hypothetical protein
MGDTVRDKYIKYRTNPDNDDKSDAFFCTQNCISLDEINEMRSIDKKLNSDILKARRDTYAKRMAKIDHALFRAAEAGDTKAADLIYRRFDGWNPKIVEETNNYYNFTDMVKGMRKKKATIKKRPM